MQRNVLITGAKGGIGKAIIEVFAKNSYNILACIRSKDENFENYLKEISNKYNILTMPIYFDMTDYQAMKCAIKEIYSKKIKIDVLINNAGKAHGGFFQMTPISKIKEIFEINLFAQMELTQLILKLMIREKEGTIVNISSISGLDLNEGNCAYGTSKAALIAWTKTLASECAKYNIRVNSVAPGLTDTNMAKLMEEKAGRNMINASAMKRLAKPQEIAQAVFFLASNNSSFVNGEILRVDGGSSDSGGGGEKLNAIFNFKPSYSKYIFEIKRKCA